MTYRVPAPGQGDPDGGGIPPPGYRLPSTGPSPIQQQGGPQDPYSGVVPTDPGAPSGGLYGLYSGWAGAQNPYTDWAGQYFSGQAQGPNSQESWQTNYLLGNGQQNPLRYNQELGWIGGALQGQAGWGGINDQERAQYQNLINQSGASSPYAYERAMYAQLTRNGLGPEMNQTSQDVLGQYRTMAEHGYTPEQQAAMRGQTARSLEANRQGGLEAMQDVSKKTGNRAGLYGAMARLNQNQAVAGGTAEQNLEMANAARQLQGIQGMQGIGQQEQQQYQFGQNLAEQLGQSSAQRLAGQSLAQQQLAAQIMQQATQRGQNFNLGSNQLAASIFQNQNQQALNQNLAYQQLASQIGQASAARQFQAGQQMLPLAQLLQQQQQTGAAGLANMYGQNMNQENGVYQLLAQILGGTQTQYSQFGQSGF